LISFFSGIVDCGGEPLRSANRWSSK